MASGPVLFPGTRSIPRSGAANGPEQGRIAPALTPSTSYANTPDLRRRPAVDPRHARRSTPLPPSTLGPRTSALRRYRACPPPAHNTPLPPGQILSVKIVFTATSAVTDYLKVRLHGLPAEYFRGLYLNRKKVLLEDALLASGTVDQARPAIRDIADVFAALRPLRITLLDHVIVAGDLAFSFADAGIMAEIQLASGT